MQTRNAPIRRTAAVLVLIGFLHGAALSSAEQRPVNLRVLQDKEKLVLTVGTRLAMAATGACSRKAPALGISLHDVAQYSPAYRTAARVMFARSDLPALLAVADGGPAAAAGASANDAVVAIDGAPVPPPGGDGLARVEAVMRAAEQAAMVGPVRLTMVHEGREVTRSFVAPPACAVRFQVEPDSRKDALTNGWLVEVTTGLLDFVSGPDELAAVLGHEMGHVILDHRRLVGEVSRAESRHQELDADRLGVKLAAAAGYRPEAALQFWQRMRAEGGSGPSGLGRHPADSARIAAVRQALAELAAGNTRLPPGADLSG